MVIYSNIESHDWAAHAVAAAALIYGGAELGLIY